MKLYNLYKTIIFEEIMTSKELVTESVSEKEIKDAIDGKYNVSITYRDKEGVSPSRRYIQVYNIGVTKKGNLAIRAFQIKGYSTRGKRIGFWKMFRLDRIESWAPRFGDKWARAASDRLPSIPKYNTTGDRSMIRVIKMVDPANLRLAPRKSRRKVGEPQTEIPPVESPLQTNI
jgi:hypothetical protein